MSISTVAQLAGVSPSTVSRVLNEHPNVAASTVENVRRVMRELNFAPTHRRWTASPRMHDGVKTTTIAFIVFGTSGSRPTPAFELLLRGVSEQASKIGLNLIFSFVSDPSHLPPRIAERRVGGVLLHGERPGPEVQAQLRTLPTVWLMGNPQRPVWGDQVMPDNSAIGAIAAQYLIRRGHRSLAYLGTAASWSLEIRSLAFAHAAREAGANVEIIEASEKRSDDFWQPELDFARTAQQLATSRSRPTGLFIAEDRLVPLVESAMRQYSFHRGNANGGNGNAGNGNGNGNGNGHGSGNGNGDHSGGHNGGDHNGDHNGGDHEFGPLDIISCNNERAHFAGMKVSPATIDIRAEAIGRLGVERLLWRLRRPDLPERIRCMVEPTLVEPTLVEFGVEFGT